MEWLNAPGSCDLQNFVETQETVSFDRLTVHALGRSDFWRKTHYGFIRDNGHFFYVNVSKNFEVSVTVSGRYLTLYDQGGIMVRANEENWVKAGIEFVEGIQNVSAVVTRDYSDWSVIHLDKGPESVTFGLKMKNGSFEVSYSIDRREFVMYRTAFLSEERNLQVGIMCASPDSDEGFDVEFRNFKLSYLE